ncbi:MAG: T9SS type A sorting domain-containing protein [Candidatus Kapaibacteriales bacterium]
MVWGNLNTLVFVILALFSISVSFGNLISPSIGDSIVAGRSIQFFFTSNKFKLHTLNFSTDGGSTFFPIVSLNHSPTISWSPPQKDYDSIIFKYTSTEFLQPYLLYRIDKANNGEVTSISISPDSTLYASSGLDGKIFIFRMSDGKKVDSLNLSPNKIFKVIFLWDNNNLLFSVGSTIYFWYRPLKFWFPIYFAKDLIRAVDYNKRGIIALGSYDQSFVVLDVQLFQLLSYWNDTKIYSTAISDDGRYVAFGDYNGMVRIFELATRRLINSLNTNKSQSLQNVVWALDFSKNGKQIVTGGIDGFVNVWDVESSKLLYSIPSHSFQVRGVQFNDDFPIVLSASLDSTIKQFYFESSKEIHSPIYESSQVTALSTTSKKGIFIIGMRNGDIAVYRNFKVIYDSSTQTNPFFIPIKVKTQSILAKVGEVVALPIIVSNPLGIDLVHFNQDTSFANLIFPRDNFIVFDNKMSEYNTSGNYQIVSTLKNIGNNDTLAVLKLWIMHTDSTKFTFKIDNINFRGKKNLLWDLALDSIETYENCPTVRSLTSFVIAEGLDFEFSPNPTSDVVNLKVFSTFNEADIEILLMDLAGRSIKNFFKGKVTKGSNSMRINLENVMIGTYFLVLKWNEKFLAKKLLICR